MALEATILRSRRFFIHQYRWPVSTIAVYGIYGHIRDMAIVAIDAIVDQGHLHGFLESLDLRIAASEADFD